MLLLLLKGIVYLLKMLMYFHINLERFLLYALPFAKRTFLFTLCNKMYTCTYRYLYISVLFGVCTCTFLVPYDLRLPGYAKNERYAILLRRTTFLELLFCTRTCTLIFISLQFVWFYLSTALSTRFGTFICVSYSANSIVMETLLESSNLLDMYS